MLALLPAIAAVFPARHLGLPDPAASAAAMLVFGAAGGLSHVMLVRSMGGDVSRLSMRILPLVWGLICAAGATPLFFTFGTPVKMAVLAFYSFASLGALGGWITACGVSSAFKSLDSNRAIPLRRYLLAWGLGLGSAALSVNAVSELLRIVISEKAASFLSIGAMPLLIGAGAGYSLLSVLGEEGTTKKGVWVHGGSGVSFALLFVTAAPFYLNDFSNILIKSWSFWLLIDYTSRLFPLLLLFLSIRSGRIGKERLGFTVQRPAAFISVFLIGALAGMFISKNGPVLLSWMPGYPRLGGMPAIENPAWRWFDLTVGLMLAAVSEEAVFRGLLYAFLRRFFGNLPLVIGISSAAFGLIHWNEGFNRVMVTGLIGAVFMVLYSKTNSLPAIAAAHFAVNFISSDVLPGDPFRFF